MDTPGVDIDIVVPVHDEEGILDANLRRLHRHLSDSLDMSWRIVVADNASRDGSGEIARRLSAELGGIAVLSLDAAGRGGAVRGAWLESQASILVYMDADLSTDLGCLEALLEPLLHDGADLCLGSRLVGGAHVRRSLRREALSRGYGFLVRKVLGLGVTDPQCGFKAITVAAAHRVLPRIKNRNWFFDTELVWWSLGLGLRVHEIPVAWTERRPSSVRLVATVVEDLVGIIRLLWTSRRRSGLLTRSRKEAFKF